MNEIRHEETEVVSTGAAQPETVTATDPVTGQVVQVNRTTGEVVTRPAVTQTTYERMVDAPSGLHEQQVHHVSEDPYAVRRVQTFKIVQTIYLIFGVIEALIAIRFVLRLLGANPQAGFASFVYGITRPFIAPFVGLFGTPVYNGSAIEVHSIVAIFVYALVAGLLVRVVWLALGETRSGYRTTTERIDRHIP